MRKYVHGFEMRYIMSNATGDVYRAGCYEGGRWYTVERIANGYTQREIARLLRAALLRKLNGGAE